ncbi:MAG TPA: FHA domain-containing protein [Pyrinomonadaceae bacterium]|jgi:hypothetical protein
MITCDRCQTENIEGSQYCDECGASLQTAGPATRPRAAADGAPSEPGPFAADTGAALQRAASELRPAAASHAFVSSATGRARAHEDSAPPRRESGAAPHAKLVIHRGRSVGKEFPMCEEESHIGRWDADGGIFPDVDLDSDDPEAKVSRRHARITRRGGQYYIEDLGSTNGTFVNRGRRLLPGDRQPLRDGDEVIVGKTFLKFHVLNG